RRRLEVYLGSAGDPERSALLRHLLLLDWEYRRCAGDDPRAGDYHPRFPGDVALIEDVGREMAGSPDSTRVRSGGTHALQTPWPGATERSQVDVPPPAEARPAR